MKVIRVLRFHVGREIRLGRGRLRERLLEDEVLLEEGADPAEGGGDGEGGEDGGDGHEEDGNDGEGEQFVAYGARQLHGRRLLASSSWVST